MEYTSIITEQTVIMFIIIAAGALCYKLNIITQDANKHLSNVVLQIVMPVMIFTSYQTEYSHSLLNGLLWSFLLSVICFAVTIPLSMLVFKKDDGGNYVIERFSVIYSNCAFMGFPLIDGVFGAEGILYTTAFVTVFNIFVWTHGVMTMKNEVSFKSFLKALKSPTVIAVFLGIICYVTNIRLPKAIGEALNYISSMNTPLAMLIAGVTIAQTNILGMLKNYKIYIVTAMKLIIVPIICAFILHFIPVSEIVYISVVIAAACPAAAIGTLFALSYNRNANYASEIFAFTTLFSAITIPLVVIIAQSF